MSRENHFPTLPDQDLELASCHARGARQLLAYAYALVARHHTLSVQCETAGKSAVRLIEAIEARRTPAQGSTRSAAPV